jgi:hypothetical protein
MLVAAIGILYAVWFALTTTAFWFVKVDNVSELFTAFFSAGRFPDERVPRLGAGDADLRGAGGVPHHGAGRGAAGTLTWGWALAALAWPSCCWRSPRRCGGSRWRTTPRRRREALVGSAAHADRRRARPPRPACARGPTGRGRRSCARRCRERPRPHPLRGARLAGRRRSVRRYGAGRWAAIPHVRAMDVDLSRPWAPLGARRRRHRRGAGGHRRPAGRHAPPGDRRGRARRHPHDQARATRRGGSTPRSIPTARASRRSATTCSASSTRASTASSPSRSSTCGSWRCGATCYGDVPVYWGITSVTSDRSQRYWLTRNRAVFPAGFEPTLAWHRRFAGRGPGLRRGARHPPLLHADPGRDPGVAGGVFG